MSFLKNLFSGNSEKQFMDQIFNLKFTSKQLVRQAKKAEKEERSETMKVKKAIEKGNMDGARIYAQNAIRKKSEQLNYLRLGSRLDAVVARLESQSKMNNINKNMSGIVKSLEKALNSNNLEQVAMTMDSFEKQFENLDVQAEFVEQAMGNTTALSTPQSQVDELLVKVAKEHELNLVLDMPTPSSGMPVAQKVQQAEVAAAAPVPVAVEEEEDDLSRRLRELRGK
mmetsp:Transcript_6915/g.11968  ORF Transcript_6915/g.11968 Transcript_6915/m.11968 type:complete len:226 (+) Transcript_6915:398-1075(+)|eukprot:CAMPEP_0198209834 /NCGR_PEP_ID=MMETSP1445-20131203/17763_1 /TAXON_ID=36898 /ORGANISM="Pyramimonas sp., Strain CCMP2087" /LENGTH=225 /DNA_ID=CAMNT_0043883731 /DNA_START=375 /DNA_END=1052 /DNA_ORIENTATION=+